MRVLRTPDARFLGLPDYPFAPRYGEVDGLRMHYVEVGPPEAPPILLLHGEPSWSFLYRHMIARLAAAGQRVIAPDLIGFGRSDKPADPSDYSYARHVAWMKAFITALDLHAVTLFCQDWGGLIGLRLAAENPDRFARIIAANTGLPTGHERLSEAFASWQKESQTLPEFRVGRIVAGACDRKLSAAEIAAYDAPFPDESYKAGARRFPLLVPTSPNDPASAANQAAWRVLEQWQKPFLTLFSDHDPFTRGADRPFRERIPGAAQMPHASILNAGHFLQEDASEVLCALIIRGQDGIEIS